MKKLDRLIAIVKLRALAVRAFMSPKLNRKKKMIRSLAVLLCLLLLGFTGVMWRKRIEDQKPVNILKRYNQTLSNQSKLLLTNPAALPYNSEDATIKMTATLKPSAFSETDRDMVEKYKNITLDSKLHAEVSGNLSFTSTLTVAKINITAELRAINKKDLYFKLGGLKSLGIDELVKDMTPEEITAFNQVTDYMDNKWFFISGGLSSTTGIPKETQDKINNGLLNLLPHMLIAGDKLPDSTISGKKAYGLNVTLNKSAISDYYGSLYDAIPGLTAEQITQTKEDINKLLEKYDLSKYPLQLYVDKQFSGYQSIKYNHSYEHAEIALVSESTPSKGEGNVIAPDDAHSLLELIGNIQKLVSESTLKDLESSIIPPSSAVKTTEEQNAELLDKISLLYPLPTDEVPTIATVEDPSKLTDQPFFVNAVKGDKLVIFNLRSLAILYRESTNQIINSGAISIGESTITQ